MASLLDNINTLISGILTNAVYPATDMNPLLTQVVTLANPSYQAVTMVDGGTLTLDDNVGVARLSTAVNDFDLTLPDNAYTNKRVKIFVASAVANTLSVKNQAGTNIYSGATIANTTLEFICTNGSTDTWVIIQL